MNEAMIPDRAPGMTTPLMTSKGVPPRAYPPWRSERGTARIASSQSEATMGRTMIPTTIDALAALKISVEGKADLSTGVMKVRAK